MGNKVERVFNWRKFEADFKSRYGDEIEQRARMEAEEETDPANIISVYLSERERQYANLYKQFEAAHGGEYWEEVEPLRTSEAQRRAVRKYQQAHETHKATVTFHEPQHGAEWEWLQQHRGKSDYIRRLIHADMERNRGPKLAFPNVIAALDAKGWSDRDFESAADVPPCVIEALTGYDREQAGYVVRIGEALRCAEALGLDVDELWAAE